MKDQGIDEKTLILFTSDNGDENSYYEYTKRFGATGPLKGKRAKAWEAYKAIAGEESTLRIKGAAMSDVIDAGIKVLVEAVKAGKA